MRVEENNMNSNALTEAGIAKPTINEVFTQFLEVQAKRLSPKTLRRYEEVISLLQDHLDNYGHDGLSAAERALFEKYHNMEGKNHRAYCDLFGPQKISGELGSFFGYFMIRKVMAGEDLKRTSGTVVKKLSQWLLSEEFISEKAAADGMEEGSEAATVLPLAEKASRILFEHAENSGLHADDFEDNDDYIEFDHLTISKLELGKLWLDYHDVEGSKSIGPIAVPSSATKLLRVGWDISCGLGRKCGKWQIVEMGNIYPN